MSIMSQVLSRESQLRMSIVLLPTIAVLAAADPVRADGFVSPYIGYNFGGDAGCPHITGCQDKRVNAGVALGTLGGLFGFEEDFGYATNFFGTAPGLSSSVLTLMSNVLIGPTIGPAQPYALAGIGLVKTHVSFTP